MQSNNPQNKTKAQLLIEVHKKLNLLFPNQNHIALMWLDSKNKAFDDKSPIDVIKETPEGVQSVIAYLDQHISM